MIGHHDNILFPNKNSTNACSQLISLKIRDLSNISAHVVVGPLSPGVVLIVKSCGTNFSANVNCMTMKFSTH